MRYRSPPLTAFLEYKLNVKIIVSFCTHGGGESGHIFEDIARLCPKCEIGEGFSVMRRSTAEEDISERLKKLELLKL